MLTSFIQHCLLLSSFGIEESGLRKKGIKFVIQLGVFHRLATAVISITAFFISIRDLRVRFDKDFIHSQP